MFNFLSTTLFLYIYKMNQQQIKMIINQNMNAAGNLL